MIVRRESSVELAEEPTPYRFDRDQYYKMAELGWFAGRKVELIEGEIVVQSPQLWPHAVTTDRSAEVLRIAFGPGCWVRTQLPLALGLPLEPESDVSVVSGSREDYSDHPTSALLVVEVSDTTLRYDRGRKASAYAKANITDYWIVNLNERQLEVRRNPVPDETQPHGFGYGECRILQPGERIAPLALPQVEVNVADLFGPP